jgi:homogentisate 1,2-dioxygenase
MGKMFEAKTSYSPYDVVGWRGNYAPCKYDLTLYNTVGSISYDHPDPSIFTVVTTKSHIEGMAAV